MQFVVIGNDGTDDQALGRRMAAREAHIQLGNRMRDSGELLYAVAILDGNQKMIGSICIVDFQSREHLDNWLKIEPYVTGRVWKKIEVLPCRVGPSFVE